MGIKKGVRGLIKNNLLSLTVFLIAVCLGAAFAGDVIIKEGDITTAGNATFGSTYKTILGDDSASKAGYFSDGSRTVDLADGSYIKFGSGDVCLIGTLYKNVVF